MISVLIGVNVLQKKITTVGNKGIIPTSIYIYLTHPPGEESAEGIWKGDRKLIGGRFSPSLLFQPGGNNLKLSQPCGTTSVQQPLHLVLDGLLGGITSYFLCHNPEEADFFKTISKKLLTKPNIANIFPIQSLLLSVFLLL